MNNTFKKIVSSFLVLLLLTGCMTIKAEDDTVTQEDETNETVESGTDSTDQSDDDSEPIVFEAEIANSGSQDDDSELQTLENLNTDSSSNAMEETEPASQEEAEEKVFNEGEVSLELEYEEDYLSATLSIVYDGDGRIELQNMEDYEKDINAGFMSLKDEEDNLISFIITTNAVLTFIIDIYNDDKLLKSDLLTEVVSDIGKETETSLPTLKSQSLRSTPAQSFNWTVPSSVNLNNGGGFEVSLDDSSLSSRQVVNVTMRSGNNFKLVGSSTGNQYNYSMHDETGSAISNGSLVLSYNGENGSNLVNTLTVDTSSMSSITFTDTYTDTITFDASLNQQTIVGVRHSTSSSSTAWERTDDAVGLSFTPSTSSVTGSSDFDSFYPYSGIVRETLSTGDVMVKIPKFYYRRYIENGYEYIEISNIGINGFELHPAFDRPDGIKDYIYVGAYTTSSNNKSVSSASPTVSQRRGTFRTNAQSKGTGWGLIDYSTVSAIQMLILVEIANTNVQTTVGYGYSSGSRAYTTGSTDSLITNRYYTGTAGSSISANADVLWRGIEGFWGNVWEWADGLNLYGEIYYICNDPSKYADDTSTGYTALSYTGSADWASAYITAMGYDADNSWAMLPTAAGSGNATSYYADAIWTASAWRHYMRGGSYWYGNVNGLFASAIASSISGLVEDRSSRLMYIPS